jgi:hypothetical protein
MSKIGITSGTAIALSVMATVLYYQPSHASDALLAKAQSEFTAKARDAVLQRRAQAQTGMVLAAVPQSEPAQTYKLASPSPAAVSAPAPVMASERTIPARPATAPVQTEAAPAQAVTADVVEAPVVVARLPDVDTAVSSETKVEEVRAEAKPLPVEHIETPKQPELPQAAAPQVVTPAAQVVTAAPQVVAPAPQVVAPAPQVATPATNSAAPATAKTQKATREAAKTVSGRNPNLRQLQREFAAGRMPYNAEALRARAPEIAAAIARYM